MQIVLKAFCAGKQKSMENPKCFLWFSLRINSGCIKNRVPSDCMAIFFNLTLQSDGTLFLYSLYAESNGCGNLSDCLRPPISLQLSCEPVPVSLQEQTSWLS